MQTIGSTDASIVLTAYCTQSRLVAEARSRHWTPGGVLLSMLVSEASTSWGLHAPLALAIQTLAVSTYWLCRAVSGKDVLPSRGCSLEMVRSVWVSQTRTNKSMARLWHLFALYDVPEQIISDNGPQFITEDFAVLMKSNGVKHLCCSPYHPASNGAVEGFVRTFK